jgi:hypothetical protein
MKAVFHMADGKTVEIDELLPSGIEAVKKIARDFARLNAASEITVHGANGDVTFYAGDLRRVIMDDGKYRVLDKR